jgi:hypothetical protein
MTVQPASKDLTIYQGATFSQVIYLKNPDGTAVNLTGYAARMQAREEVYSANYYLNLTTENGGIAIDATAGKITLNMAAADTAQLKISEGVYDLEIVSGSNVSRILSGGLILSLEVTR